MNKNLSENSERNLKARDLCQEISDEFAEKSLEMTAKLKKSDELYSLGRSCEELLDEPS